MSTYPRNSIRCDVWSSTWPLSSISAYEATCADEQTKETFKMVQTNQQTKIQNLQKPTISKEENQNLQNKQSAKNKETDMTEKQKQRRCLPNRSERKKRQQRRRREQSKWHYHKSWPTVRKTLCFLPQRRVIMNITKNKQTYNRKFWFCLQPDRQRGGNQNLQN